MYLQKNLIKLLTGLALTIALTVCNFLGFPTFGMMNEDDTNGQGQTASSTHQSSDNKIREGSRCTSCEGDVLEVCFICAKHKTCIRRATICYCPECNTMHPSLRCPECDTMTYSLRCRQCGAKTTMLHYPQYEIIMRGRRCPQCNTITPNLDCPQCNTKTTMLQYPQCDTMATMLRCLECDTIWPNVTQNESKVWEAAK